MSESRVPLSRLSLAAAATAAPAAAVLLVLAVLGELRPAMALGAAVLTVAGVALLLYRHLAALEALRRRLAALARGETAPPAPRHFVSSTAAAVAGALGELERSWTRRGAEVLAIEATSAAVLEVVPDPLLLIDKRRTVLRANAAARALLGDGVAGSTLDTVLRHPEVLAAVEDCLDGVRELAAIDMPWPGPPERDFDVRVEPLPESAGVAGAALVVLHDMTALRQAERMRADFVANVSHELRTPLASLLGITETLRGAARDDAAARERFLAIMQEQAQRMSRLVSDLLSLSRIEASEHTRPVDPVALGKVVSGVADALAVPAAQKSVAIDIAIPPDLPPVAGDADQLAQVMQNLIDNAIKYNKPKGRVQVVGRIAAPPPRLPASPAGWVALSVGDEGDGIARAHLPRLTERFYRVDTARSRQLGGTGLGLAIVKHVLNRHRGALTIESEPGQGSTFTVWLPVRAESSPRPESHPQPPS